VWTCQTDLSRLIMLTQFTRSAIAPLMRTSAQRVGYGVTMRAAAAASILRSHQVTHTTVVWRSHPASSIGRVASFTSSSPSRLVEPLQSHSLSNSHGSSSNEKSSSGSTAGSSTAAWSRLIDFLGSPLVHNTGMLMMIVGIGGACYLLVNNSHQRELMDSLFDRARSVQCEPGQHFLTKFRFRSCNSS
jgi:hypothetical protein